VGYEEARARLAAVLAAVSITAPTAAKIRKVYENAPGTIGDIPCCILYGSAGSREWTLGGADVIEEHTERVRLLLRDADLDRAAHLVRAFREAILTALATESGLNGTAVISRLAWEEPSGYEYGREVFTGMDLLVTFAPLAAE